MVHIVSHYTIIEKLTVSSDRVKWKISLDGSALVRLNIYELYVLFLTHYISFSGHTKLSQDPI